ncbi:hypothetical protein [Paenirhodobacter populi]|uniref:hypothetical protein n=1 Tax=Paenirhodobacter populi TaxID=2306993 RepID=UPI0013E3B1DD|nr:hypothetical protein [Sinirhodobacter populi]
MRLLRGRLLDDRQGPVRLLELPQQGTSVCGNRTGITRQELEGRILTIRKRPG